MNKLDYFTVAGAIIGGWKGENVSISYGDAFGSFVDEYRTATGRNLSKQINSSAQTLTRSNSFSMSAVGEEGDTVAMAAARIDDLDDEPMCEFWKRYFPRIYSSGELGIQLNPSQPAVLEHVTGKIAYLSDLWVAKEFRNKRIGQDFTVLAQIISRMFFEVDYVYFFISKEMYDNGNYFKYAGMTTHVECGTIYDVPPVDINEDDVLLLNDKRGIEHMVRLRASKSSMVVQRK